MPTKLLGPWNLGLNLTNNRDLSVFLDEHELGEATNIVISPEGFVEPRPGFKVLLSNGVDDLYQKVGEAPPVEITLLGSVDAGVKGVYAIIQVYANNVAHIYKVRDEDVKTTDHNIEYIGRLNDKVKGTHIITHSGFIKDYVDLLTGYIYKADTGVILFTDTEGVAFMAPLDLDATKAPIIAIDPMYKIPASHMGMVVKDRLFLFNRDKNIMHWGPAQYILDFRNDAATEDAAPFGDDSAGQEIIEPTTPDDVIRGVEFYNNNFYIFKRISTFMFTYQTSPLVDGYLRKISGDMGAFDSCIYKENIVVVNNKGVFRIEGTEFIDIQGRMNFRFEIPIDHPQIGLNDIFITNFNNTILVGFMDKVSTPGIPKYHYYSMNALTGAWSKWSFNYENAVAAPGSSFVFSQIPNTIAMKMLFVDFSRTRIVYAHWKPNPVIYDYHLDSTLTNTKVRDYVYIPDITIKTSASFGDSMLTYKKLYRYYLRFYLSDIPVEEDEAIIPPWTLSINYNDYRFNNTMNPIFKLYPEVNKTLHIDPRIITDDIITSVYDKVYQIALPQQRVKEFVFELKRKSTRINSSVILINLDVDRPVKAGYYFLLAGLWIDYQDKTGI